MKYSNSSLINEKKSALNHNLISKLYFQFNEINSLTIKNDFCFSSNTDECDENEKSNNIKIKANDDEEEEEEEKIKKNKKKRNISSNKDQRNIKTERNRDNDIININEELEKNQKIYLYFKKIHKIFSLKMSIIS